MSPTIRDLLKVNDVVSYKSSSISGSGKPVLPLIYRIRSDLTWEEVIASCKLPRRRHAKTQGGDTIKKVGRKKKKEVDSELSQNKDK